MDTISLTQTRIRAGVWEGILTGGGPQPPKIEVLLLERALPGVTLAPVPGRPGDYALRVPIPADVLNEGVQTFLIRAADQTLAHFTIVTGVAMEDDLRAEIDLLRAELDMLKRAFRRHCLETMG
ncbi:hypothetical protein [Neotabrizicola sp. VNH66]|uniref:hypothetical protein n=1 Tax=Neotabrizicola sp. VNH66 TaxID=3400918 RepID=UPI003C08C4FA